MSKAALRARLRDSTVNVQARAEQSAMVCTRTLALPVVRDASSVALFVGVGHEPDTRALFAALAPKRRWLPAVRSPTALGWAEVTDLATLQVSRWGLHEPAEASSSFPDVDVVLVPGLAFDDAGGRLGWGRGYYDRALSTRPAVVRVGLCLRAGRLDETIPMEAHDLRMHGVVTPDAFISVR